MSSYGNIQKYRIVERIARGGMGVVYLAEDNLGRSVAIKVLHQNIEDDELRERFEREARAAGGLSHPNIVTIYEFGEHEDQPFIAMEYVSGETLAQIIKRRAPVPLVRKLQYIEDLCAGLAYAHKAGVVHRDVKPANVIVKDQTYLKILDFGIARVASSSITQAGLIMGTPSYMAPEQALGRPTDHRSDVFAVGLVMYELLAFRQAFPGETAHGVIHRIIYEQAEPLATLCPELDPGLYAIVARAIEKDPADRYQDLGTMRSEIARIRQRLEHLQEEATVLVPKPAAPQAQGSSSATPSATPSASSRQTHQELRERRAKQIEMQLAEARRCLEAGALDAALEACRQAGALDPDDGRTLELLDRVRNAIDEQKVRDSLDSSALRRELQQRQREEGRALEARERRRAADEHVVAASECLAGGDLAAAGTHIDAAIDLVPGHGGAKKLRHELLQGPTPLELPSETEQQSESTRTFRPLVIAAASIAVVAAAAGLWLALGPAEGPATNESVTVSSEGRDVAPPVGGGDVNSVESRVAATKTALRTYLDAGDVRAAARELASALSLKADDPDLAALENQIFEAVISRARSATERAKGRGADEQLAQANQGLQRASELRGARQLETSVAEYLAVETLLANPTPGRADVAAEARRLLTARNLNGAMAKVREGLAAAPGNESLLAAQSDVVKSAASRTLEARRVAEKSGASAHVAYKQGLSREQNAGVLQNAGKLDPAFDEYVAAENAFRSSMTTIAGEIAAIEGRVRGSIAAGNLLEAFREADGALKRSATDVRAQGLVAQVVTAAASAADTARARASAEQALTEPSFGQADGRLQAAQRARTEGRSEQAVRDYMAAEKLFLEAIPAAATLRTVDTRVSRGAQLLKEGRLTEAAAEASASLALRSGHEGARGLHAKILAAARDRAAGAHEKASKANATSLPGYQEATAREKHAASLKNPAELENAVRDYLEAERQFLATVSAASSTTPVTAGGRAAMASAAREVDQALQRYAAAYGNMAVNDLRAIFPKVSKRRIDGMAKNRSACRAYQVVFGQPKIELVPDGRVLVDVSTSYECTPRAGGGVLPFTITEQMTLGAQPGGGLLILSIAEP